MTGKVSPIAGYVAEFRIFRAVDERSPEHRILSLLASDAMSSPWTRLLKNDKGPKSPLNFRLFGLFEGAFQAHNRAVNLKDRDWMSHKATNEKNGLLAAVNLIERFYSQGRAVPTWHMLPNLKLIKSDILEHFESTQSELKPGFYTSSHEDRKTCFAVNFGIAVHTAFGNGNEGFNYDFVADATNILLEVKSDDLLTGQDVRKALKREKERRAPTMPAN